MPAVISATKYGMKNAPPPFWNAMAGKRQRLPSPTALPIAAMMNAVRLVQRSLCSVAIGHSPP